MKLSDEFRRGWQGIAQPSPLFGIAFAAFCLALGTAARWGFSLIRPDLYFTPYMPAVFFTAAVAGLRPAIFTAAASGILGLVLNFGETRADPARVMLLLIYWAVCALAIWGVEHYRSTVARERRITKRLIEEEEYRKLMVAELQHRLKNKLSTIHAVLHQVLERDPEVWTRVDHRLRALSTVDDLIARVDNAGCDIKDLLLSELTPYGHVRFNLNGPPLFLPDKLAVSLSLIFHELATNAAKYGAFSAARGLLQVSWTISDDRLNVVWDETEGPPIDQVGPAGFGTKLLKSALVPFDGKTEITYLKTGVHCTMQCRIPKA
ncbi:MAG TPA: HWE histidine kinase domain-containing protein [Bradyrhizobium sp.]|nr:HWE histidine kinase domain-containing protein [Bradyrhizobium sp.]